LAVANHEVDGWVEGHGLIYCAMKLHSSPFQGSEDLTGDHGHILGCELRGGSRKDGLLANQVREWCGDGFRKVIEGALSRLLVGISGRPGEPCYFGL